MVAELAVGLLLATAKFIVPLDRALRADDWTPRFQPARSLLLSGRTCLVLGYGAIGQRVARVCHAFGMRDIATRRGPPTSDGIAEVHPPRAMPDLLPQAHALIVCLPLTPETEGLIGANELRLLPDKSILVNIGRGPIVDEDALYTALVENTIGGAGLDVWYNYPADEASYGETAPSQHRFGDLDNVVLSPHRGGKVIGTEAMRMQGMAELLNCAASGRPIPNQIDPGRGY
jgi:phosphoglycerate dehydrogenase-like enzyme